MKAPAGMCGSNPITMPATSPRGSFLDPFHTFGDGEAVVPPSGTLMIQPGNYSAVGRHSKAMRLRSPLGDVKLGG